MLFVDCCMLLNVADLLFVVSGLVVRRCLLLFVVCYVLLFVVR